MALRSHLLFILQLKNQFLYFSSLKSPYFKHVLMHTFITILFAPLQGQRWHQGSGFFGRNWQLGDVVGCMINLDDKSMIFTLNGELLITNKGSELAFADFEIDNGMWNLCLD